MDKKFLDKVIDQIVSETSIDYKKEKVYTPFFSLLSSFPSSSFFLSFLLLLSPPLLFRKHCRDVYGLNEEETEYVWNNYRQIIIDK